MNSPVELHITDPREPVIDPDSNLTRFALRFIRDARDIPFLKLAALQSAIPADSNWRRALEREVAASLARGEKEIFDGLNRSFEAALITKALEHTGGRRIEAALLLGIGRNTLTRKIQDLGLDGGADT